MFGRLPRQRLWIAVAQGDDLAQAVQPLAMPVAPKVILGDAPAAQQTYSIPRHVLLLTLFVHPFSRASICGLISVIIFAAVFWPVRTALYAGEYTLPVMSENLLT